MSRVDQGPSGLIRHPEAVLVGVDLSLGQKRTFSRARGAVPAAAGGGATLCSWWRSSRASAPATSLASSSALISACISVTQLLRSRKSAVKRCSLSAEGGGERA